MSQLHNTGENFVLTTNLSNTDLDVGLYNSSDGLADSDNIGAVTTEPDDTQDYARQSQTFTVSGNTVETTTVEFSVSANTEVVDKYFVLTSGGDLMFTGDLNEGKDLTDIDILNVDNVSGNLD